MKIMIIGQPGAGKTYLAQRLSAKTGIDALDVDGLFDKHPFNALSKKLYARSLYKILADKHDFIVDGYHVNLMPDELWKNTDQVIYINLPKEELKQNVRNRQLLKKAAGDFSHWQSYRANNLKNFAQIRFQDKAFEKDMLRIQSLLRDVCLFYELKSRDDIENFINCY